MPAFDVDRSTLLMSASNVVAGNTVDVQITAYSYNGMVRISCVVTGADENGDCARAVRQRGTGWWRWV